MPENKSTNSGVDAEKAVVSTGSHDRVQMVSISKDGTPDQTSDFEIVGDKDAALAATKEQFAQIAVSRVDAEKRAELGLASTADTEPSPDAAIDALRAEQEKAVAAAEKKAEALVNAAHRG